MEMLLEYVISSDAEKKKTTKKKTEGNTSRVTDSVFSVPWKLGETIWNQEVK